MATAPSREPVYIFDRYDISYQVHMFPKQPSWTGNNMTLDLDTVLQQVPYLRDWLHNNHRLGEAYMWFWAWRKQSLLRATFRLWKRHATRQHWIRTLLLRKIVHAQDHYVALHILERHGAAEDYAELEPVLYPAYDQRNLWGFNYPMLFDLGDDTTLPWYYICPKAAPVQRDIPYTVPRGIRPTFPAFHPYIQSWLTDWDNMTVQHVHRNHNPIFIRYGHARHEPTPWTLPWDFNSTSTIPHPSWGDPERIYPRLNPLRYLNWDPERRTSIDHFGILDND